MTKTMGAMIKEANAEVEEVSEADVVSLTDEPLAVAEAIHDAAEGEVTRTLMDVVGQVEPLQRGIAYLRARELDPLRLWTVKSPKGVGGTLSAVFLQATSEVVILQQLASGKFVVFEKATV